MRISDCSSDVCSSDLTNPDSGSRIAKVFKSLQPKASLSYFFTDDKMIYASAARGFRSGGFNAQSQIFPRQYGSEIAETYEVGTKLTLADRRVQLNLAGFYTDQKNVQFYRSEEHPSELQSLMRTSYAVFCLKKK